MLRLMTWVGLICLTPGMLSSAQLHQASIRDHLVRYGAPAQRAGQVAELILDQSARWSVDPAMVTAIMTVENPELRSRARSSAGARGLMQVMPFWERRFARHCGQDRQSDAVNVCLGIQVWRTMLAEHKTPERALLAYNGCPSRRARCGFYSTLVQRRQSQIRQSLDTASTLALGR